MSRAANTAAAGTMSWAQKERTEQYSENEAAAVQQGLAQHKKTTQSAANAARVGAHAAGAVHIPSSEALTGVPLHVWRWSRLDLVLIPCRWRPSD